MDEKQIKLEQIVKAKAIIEEYYHKHHPKPSDVLRMKGFNVVWCRILISGGIGSLWWLPRKKVWRMQIEASTWAKKGARNYWHNGIPYKQKQKNIPQIRLVCRSIKCRLFTNVVTVYLQL